MSGGKAACATCSHPGAFHILPIGPCRRNGCACDKFVDPGKPAREETEDERTLVIRIPEGYEALVRIVPVVSDGS